MIEKEVNKMLDLKNVAHEAQTADIQVIVTKMEQGSDCRDAPDLMPMQQTNDCIDVATLLQDGAQKSQAKEIQEVLSRTGKGQSIEVAVPLSECGLLTHA